MKHQKYIYEIQYTKISDKFFKTHEDVRKQYENSIKELMVGEHPEKVDVKRIKGKGNNYYRIRIGGYRVIYDFPNAKSEIRSEIWLRQTRRPASRSPGRIRILNFR